MAHNEDILWLVNKRHSITRVISRSWLFRTREAARRYQHHMMKRMQVGGYWTYTVNRAIWGPDNIKGVK